MRALLIVLATTSCCSALLLRSMPCRSSLIMCTSASTPEEFILEAVGFMKLSSFDVYPKTLQEFKQRTLTGALISITSIVLIVLLALVEIVDFAQIKTNQMLMDVMYDLKVKGEGEQDARPQLEYKDVIFVIEVVDAGAGV